MINISIMLLRDFVYIIYFMEKDSMHRLQK